MPIQVLPVNLVNKIAAGEVIERPASVVKELVENSIDAVAARIDVAIEDGGRKLIAIADDGCGMNAQDLALAFAPHATSKIATYDDLYNIATMGFRGEALASIASISHAHIRTRRRPQATPDGDAAAPPQPMDQSGYEIEASGDDVGQVRPCAAPPGTTITIRDLFFNTPARRKFLKTTNTEMGHISEQITRLALPHPQVAFTLTHNGRSTLKLPATRSTAQRAADLFGADLGATLLPVANRGGRVGIAGLIARPSGARASAQWQYFFLNGRYIRDRLLAHALKEAFRGQIDPNRFPVGFIFLTVDPAEVDVNVHPTKVEVRFREPQLIHGELLAALRETLNRANLSPTASFAETLISPGATTPNGKPAPGNTAMPGVSGNPPISTGQNASPTITDAEAIDASAEPAQSPAQESRRASLRQAMADFFRSVPPPQPRLSFPESRKEGRGEKEERRGQSTAFDATQRSPLSPLPSSILSSTPSAAPAMQIHDSYIVASCEEGLLIIDQHALHERLIYDDLKRRLAGAPLAGQRLLIPLTLSVSPHEAQALLARGDLLAHIGIEVESFGPATIAIQQFPCLLTHKGVAPDAFIREVMDKLAEDEDLDAEHLLEELLQMLACKAAVKAGTPLGAAEIQALLAARHSVEKAFACPHGRPTMLRMTLRDLEKQFKRS